MYVASLVKIKHEHTVCGVWALELDGARFHHSIIH